MNLWNLLSTTSFFPHSFHKTPRNTSTVGTMRSCSFCTKALIPMHVILARTRYGQRWTSWLSSLAYLKITLLYRPIFSQRQWRAWRIEVRLRFSPLVSLVIERLIYWIFRCNRHSHNITKCWAYSPPYRKFRDIHLIRGFPHFLSCHRSDRKTSYFLPRPSHCCCMGNSRRSHIPESAL